MNLLVRNFKTKISNLSKFLVVVAFDPKGRIENTTEQNNLTKQSIEEVNSIVLFLI
jgi:hypothetical protein